MKCVVDALARHRTDRANQPAVIDPDGAVTTYAGLGERVDLIRAFIDARTEAGECIGVSLRSGADFWAALLGISSAGRVPVLLPYPLPSMIAARPLQELGVRLTLDPAALADAQASSARETRQREPRGAILLSSGTTGHSRFIVRSVEGIARVALKSVEDELVTAGERLACFLPMFHAYGFEQAFLAPLIAGATVDARGSFSTASAFAAIAAGATTIPLTPMAVAALVESGEAMNSLRCVVSAGASLPSRVRALFESRSAGVLIDLYGATELGTIWLDSGRGGRPVQGVKIRLVNPELHDRNVDSLPNLPGEVAVQSDSMLESVIHRDGSRSSGLVDGWFRTGDLAVRRDGGLFSIVGRCKLIFDVDGLKVNPIEVEEALESHPAIRRALVEPDEAGGMVQRVVARVELHEGAPPVNILDVRAFLSSRIASHMLPRQLDVVATLPRTATGKLLRTVTNHASSGQISEVAREQESMPPVSHRPEGITDRTRREEYTQRLFDASADGYDNSSGVAFMSLGRWYRRRMLAGSGLKSGSAHLDVGSGTGLCAAIGQSIVGPTGRAVALDPSPGMLAVARRRGVRETIIGSAERIPAESHAFDVVSMGYMLRHVDDMLVAFSEARRVLRPGGRIVIMELTRPLSFGLRHGFDLAMFFGLPAIGVLASGRVSTYPMMRYWARTIADAARPEQILRALERSGFVGTRHRVDLGVFSCYRGVAPLA